MYTIFLPEQAGFGRKKNNKMMDANFIQKNKREIASVQNENTKSLHFDCSKENQETPQEAQVSSAQVLIKFENCQIKQTATQFKLVNQSNQYMAQIFRPSENVIVTDFIQLALGENILKFEFSLNDKQKKTQIIKIQRINSEIQ